MVSKEQIEANQKNALLATGPKSNEGKVAISQNARKHGILSKRVFIDKGQEQKFNKLAQGFYAEFRPHGSLEFLLVEKVVVSVWRLSLILRVESELLEKDSYSFNANYIKDAFEGYSSGSMRILSRYEKSLENSFYRALNELKTIQHQRKLSESKEIVIDSLE